jgi:hypothetical protein
MYCRCPGGILVECAATTPGAFARDEDPRELGTHLLLPPWLEERRAEIVAMLEPIRVPENNLPVGAPEVIVAPAASPRKAVFIGGESSKN